MDQTRVTEFLERFVTDVGATGAAGSVVVGNRLGLYGALARGPATPTAFAERTGCAVRPLTEWLRGQAAGGYVTYEPATGEFSLTEEQAFCLVDPDGPNVSEAYRLVLGYLRAEEQIAESFRTGTGMPWHAHHEDVFTGCAAFYRAGYVTDLVPTWIPALDGVRAKLEAGARVADVGCGLGESALLLAKAFPRSTVVGSDYHAESVDGARKRAADAGLTDRVRFEVASAQGFTGADFDLVAMFDCLHDMGDPVGAARRVREALAPDGTWMVVEPRAGESVADNLNPVGRLYYSGSTFLCVPNALSQPGGYSLGAQAGEFPVRQIAEEAGFTRFRAATTSAFNTVYEIRP